MSKIICNNLLYFKVVLHNRGVKLQPTVYGETCEALTDDYEIVRSAALQLIWVLAKTYPDL